jgi:hypothetical protein
MPPIPRGWRSRRGPRDHRYQSRTRPGPRRRSSTDLEHVRGPAPVRGGGRDLAIVRALTTAAGMRRHQAVGPLMVPAPDPRPRPGGSRAGSSRDSRSSARRRPGTGCGRAARRRRPYDRAVAAGGPPGFACATRFERATPSVAITASTGNRPERATASVTAAFCPRRGERLLEDLNL